MTTTLKIENLGQFNNSLEAFLVELGHAAGVAATHEAEREMTISKRHVPVDTGDLRATGHVEPAQVQGNEVTASMGYGGPAVDYAIYVHEDLEKQHKVGQAKFLEGPARDEISSGRATMNMGHTIKRALGL